MLCPESVFLVLKANGDRICLQEVCQWQPEIKGLSMVPEPNVLSVQGDGLAGLARWRVFSNT